MSKKKWTVGLIGIFLVFCYFLYQFLTSTLKIDHLVGQMEQSKIEDKGIEHVVLIAQEIDNPFWRTVELGAKEAAAKLGMKIDYMGPIRINPAEQMNLLEKSIAAKPDAIIVQGIKEQRYDLLISKAIDQGIPVITVDADEPASRRLAYVGTDNWEAGKRMGELVVKDAGGKGRIGVMIGSELADNQQLRLEGFRSIIRNTPGFEIVAVRSSNISRIQAAKQTEAMLNQYASIQTMVGFSSLDAVGIVEGLKATNRADVSVYGFDDLEETKQGIAQGAIQASIVQQPKEIGFKSVNLLAEIFKGSSIPVQHFTATDILDRNQLKLSVGSP
ncbi:substrate-binding domain-containing protein [Paenibacillus frigoriresistens]|uniref:substrate-binding domain-containing protein n=1 Tax=Paenibacillus alginolyticus TaxID=59839 RepID=UPI001564926C|nr:substrate-binding domain-containing protein [Paenibacillus frigoriresistens]NRF90143.1 substrate-binding domain-containing protein [Paenibacillus frigoriresistens]